jgi:hypothetical protein
MTSGTQESHPWRLRQVPHLLIKQGVHPANK